MIYEWVWVPIPAPTIKFEIQLVPDIPVDLLVTMFGLPPDLLGFGSRDGENYTTAKSMVDAIRE